MAVGMLLIGMPRTASAKIGFAAHRVDVGERVGRGDAAEVERIVDHRHEEVGGRDDAGLVVEPPHRRVVAGLRADEQIGEGRRRRLLGEQLAQHGGRQLAAAAAAMGESGQAKDGSVQMEISRASMR